MAAARGAGAGQEEQVDALPLQEAAVEELRAEVPPEAQRFPDVLAGLVLTGPVVGGSPGIFSARWSGLHDGADLPRAEKDRRNLQLLLDQLADVPDEHRRAAFRCAAVLAIPGGATVTSEGEVPGVVVREPVGDNGFGYDPIFRPDGDTRTLAQYTDVEKNAISHRGRAFRAMVPLLREHLA